MPPRENLSGKRFSYLVVLKYVSTSKNGHAKWLCRCTCGSLKVVEARKLKEGQIKSCGCMQHKYNHGLTNTRLYHIWRTMKARCLDKNSHKYKDYGGRGITICREWQNDFYTFYDWAISHGYSDDLSIDRIDVNGNYCPENCRWATAKKQANNTRTNRFLTYNGETHTVTEWCEILNISKSTFYHRLARGWSEEEALAGR